MSFTHDTLINALRDVIRDEICNALRTEEGEVIEALDQRIGLRIDANGTISEMKEQVDFMSDHEDRIESLEGNSFDDLQDEVNDIQRGLDKIAESVDSMEVDDHDTIVILKENVSILDEKMGDMMRALGGIHDATSSIR
jgi:hypothetical protein